MDECVKLTLPEFIYFINKNKFYYESQRWGANTAVEAGVSFALFIINKIVI